MSEASARGGQLDAVSASWGIGVIYQVELSKETRAELTLSGAKQHVHYSESAVEFDLVAYGMLGRGEITQRLFGRSALRFGFDMLVGPYTTSGRFRKSPGRGARRGPRPHASQSEIRGGLVVRAARRVRGDGHAPERSHPGDHRHPPRLRRLDRALRRFAAHHGAPGDRAGLSKTTLKGGSGLFQQGPDLFDILLADDETKLRSARSFQNSLGAEQELSRNVTASLEGFFNLLDDLVSRSPDENGIVRYNNYGTGRIFGVEAMLRYENDERFFGWLSYTLSRSERTWAPGEPSELFYLDQTHILTVLGSYDLGRGWEFGARFRYVTGNLYTPCLGSLFSSASTSYLCVPGPTTSERLPPFHQLDIRVDKRWKFSGFTLGAYLDLINAYNRVNPDFIAYNFDYSSSRPETASLPIVPSLGVRGEF